MVALRPRLTRLWVDPPLRSQGTVVVALPLLALAAVVNGRNISLERAVRHTFEVHGQTQKVMTLLLDLPTSVRGYVPSRQPSFPAPYRSARARLPSALVRLVSLVNHDRGQGQAARRLRVAALREVALLASLHQLATRAGNTAAREREGILLRSRAGMDALRLKVQALTTAEVRQANAARRTAFILIGLSLLVGLIGAVAAMVLFLSGVARRVERLEENAGRLAGGDDLLPLPPGADEVGRVGAALDTARSLLLQRAGELRETGMFLEHIIASSPMVIFRHRVQDGTLTYVSPNVDRRLGRDPAACTAPGFRLDHVHPDDRAAYVARSSAALAQKVPTVAHPYRFRTYAGDYRWLLGVRRLEYVGDRPPATALGYALDITELRRTEASLRRAKEAAQEASQAKSRFLSSMSQELRTPLNAILGFSELLLDDETIDVAARHEYVAMVHASGRHLLELINIIVDLSRVEAGRMEINPGPVSVATAAQEAMATLQPLAARQGLRQILFNLLSNAVKFTPAGGRVWIEIVQAQGMVHTTVADTGRAITFEDQARLFAEFARLEPAAGVEGTGLGLTRGLAHLQGGEIRVQSEPGRASRNKGGGAP